MLALGDLLAEMEHDAPGDTGGLNPVEHALYGPLLEETATNDVDDEAAGTQLGNLARFLYALAAEEIHRVDFWRRRVDQDARLSDPPRPAPATRSGPLAPGTKPRRIA